MLKLLKFACGKFEFVINDKNDNKYINTRQKYLCANIDLMNVKFCIYVVCKKKIIKNFRISLFEMLKKKNEFSMEFQ